MTWTNNGDLREQLHAVVNQLNITLWHGVNLWDNQPMVERRKTPNCERTVSSPPKANKSHFFGPSHNLGSNHSKSVGGGVNLSNCVCPMCVSLGFRSDPIRRYGGHLCSVNLIFSGYFSFFYSETDISSTSFHSLDIGPGCWWGFRL